MKIINSPQSPAAIGPYSQAIEANGCVYVSGQLPINATTGDIPSTPAAQAEQSIKNIAHILKAVDLTLYDVVKTTVLLKDIKDFAEVNAVYAQMFGSHKPARAAYQVVALPKAEAVVEIEAIAVKNCCE